MKFFYDEEQQKEESNIDRVRTYEREYDYLRCPYGHCFMEKNLKDGKCPMCDAKIKDIEEAKKKFKQQWG